MRMEIEMVIYCAGCRIKVAVMVKGSSIKTGAVMLCAACETKRMAGDMAKKMFEKAPMYDDNWFSDIFKGNKIKKRGAK
jgi:hypothetical protein